MRPRGRDNVERLARSGRMFRSAPRRLWPVTSPIGLVVLTLSTFAAHAAAPIPVGRCEGSLTWLPADALPDGTPPAARQLATWLRPGGDAELLDPEAIAFLNQRNSDVIGAWRDPLADAAPAMEAVDAELVERLAQITTRVSLGELVPGPRLDSAAFPPSGAFDEVRPRIENAWPVDVVQAVVEPIDLKCVPFSYGLYRGRIDRWFDRNQCSRLAPGDMLRVLRRTDDGWLYVRAGHGVGWLEDAALSPPMTPDAARALRDRPRLTIVDDLVPARTARGELVFLRLGTGLPLVSDAAGGDYQVLVPRPEGWVDAFVERGPGVREGFLPLTRDNVLRLAFARLGDAYGWGGLGGFRDCSGLLLDVAATFDLRLGRNSSVQALAGAQTIDVSALSEADKVLAIRAAGERGVVFLYMPGHLMLYLGALDGRDYALSAISEYLLPCPEGGHRTVRIDRVDVTDLERGRGTERTAFLQRIQTLALFSSGAP